MPPTRISRIKTLSAKLGIPICVLQWRWTVGYPLDKPYTPRPYAKSSHAARHAARESGEIKYAGSACPKCKGTVRYTSSGSCVVCHDNARAPKRSDDRG